MIRIYDAADCLMVLITVTMTKKKKKFNALKYEQSDRFVAKAKDYSHGA